VAQLLQLNDGTGCAQARRIAALGLHDVRQRLADLQRIEAAPAAPIERCAHVRGRVIGPWIAELQEAARWH